MKFRLNEKLNNDLNEYYLKTDKECFKKTYELIKAYAIEHPKYFRDGDLAVKINNLSEEGVIEIPAEYCADPKNCTEEEAERFITEFVNSLRNVDKLRLRYPVIELEEEVNKNHNIERVTPMKFKLIHEDIDSIDEQITRYDLDIIDYLEYYQKKYAEDDINPKEYLKMLKQIYDILDNNNTHLPYTVDNTKYESLLEDFKSTSNNKALNYIGRYISAILKFKFPSASVLCDDNENGRVVVMHDDKSKIKALKDTCRELLMRQNCAEQNLRVVDASNGNGTYALVYAGISDANVERIRIDSKPQTTINNNRANAVAMMT